MSDPVTTRMLTAELHRSQALNSELKQRQLKLEPNEIELLEWVHELLLGNYNEFPHEHSITKFKDLIKKYK